MTVERNKRIVALREEGWSFKEISVELGMSVGYICNLYYSHCDRLGDEPVPRGMSIITARDVAAALGVWPSKQTAEVISTRMMELLRNSRKRNTMAEVSDWLQGLGLGWGDKH